MGAFSTLRGRPRAATAVALVASVAFHGALIAVSARYLASRLPAPASGAGTRMLDIALTDAVPRDEALALSGKDPSLQATRPREASHEARSGKSQEPRPDTEASGRGGTEQASERALHLSDSIDGVTLNPDPTFFTETSQVSRLETALERRSREDRRATPNPMELTFLATGTGTRLSRLEPARWDPAEGSRGAVPALAGARAEPETVVDDGFRAPTPLPVADGAVPVPALGVDHGSRRDDYRRSAAVALARPSVRQGRASIATASRGRPDDTMESSEEVASAVQSLITASSAGGPLGRGKGGTPSPGAPGSTGTSGPGSRARPAGEGGFEDTASVLGIQSYAAALTRKVYPYWEDAFPTWARIEGRGGVAVIGVTIGENGTVREIHVVRGSGIPEFDQKVATALERASPYGPLPRAVRDGGLELHIAFDAMNPAVGRAGPGAGRR